MLSKPNRNTKEKNRERERESNFPICRFSIAIPLTYRTEQNTYSYYSLNHYVIQVLHNMFFSSCWCSFSKFYYKKTTFPVFSHYWRYCWHKTLIMTWSYFLLSTNQVEETNLPLNLRTESESLVFLDGTSQSVLGASFLCVLSVFRPSVCQGPRRLHRLPHRLYHTDLYYTSFLRIQ